LTRKEQGGRVGGSVGDRPTTTKGRNKMDYYEWNRRLNLLMETAKGLGFDFETYGDQDSYVITINNNWKEDEDEDGE